MMCNEQTATTSSPLNVFMKELLMTEKCASIKVVADNPCHCGKEDDMQSSSNALIAPCVRTKNALQSLVHVTCRWTNGVASKPDCFRPLCRLPSADDSAIVQGAESQPWEAACGVVQEPFPRRNVLKTVGTQLLEVSMKE
jgi:hypothetical protein